MCSDPLVKLLEHSFILSNLEATTYMAVNYSSDSCFLKRIFESKQANKSSTECKNSIKIIK